MTGADPRLMGRSWHPQSPRIFCSLLDAEILSRTIAEASGGNGKYLRGRAQRIPSDPTLKGSQRANVSRRLSHHVRAPQSTSGLTVCLTSARFDVYGPAFFALPEYLSKSQYKSPDEPVNGAFQLGHGTKSHYFEWIYQRPELLSQFQNYMGGYRAGRPSWMDPNFYPIEENLVKGAIEEHGAVFLVDMGGGKGHDLQELNRKHATLPGILVLQDLKGVIEEAEASGLEEKIIPMEHDFFTEQPIIGAFAITTEIHQLTSLGARAYYMHSVLHNWPDSKAWDILTSLKPGLTRGYSKLLIFDNVIPDQGAHWLSTSLDMVMMSILSAIERTEQDWRTLLESAGFKVVKIWTYEPGTESLIEAELA